VTTQDPPASSNVQTSKYTDNLVHTFSSPSLEQNLELKMHLSQNFCGGRFYVMPSKGVEILVQQGHYPVVIKGEPTKQNTLNSLLNRRINKI